jgi:PHD/YefM family antitoxin component YafN of YafNO toxin-antitoxin module
MATATKPKARSKKKQRQYLVDENGKRTGVVLSMKEYQALLEAAEDLADLRAADEARAEGGQGVPLEVVEARLRAQGKLR